MRSDQEREYHRTYMKTWRKDNIEKSREACRRSRIKNPAATREANWRRHGINLSYEGYEALLVTQEYRCAVCGTHASDLNKALAVDHDHDTGKVRGLLCDSCNKAVGLLQDDPEIAMRIGLYLTADGPNEN